MHVQSAVEDFEVFARSLSIGAETMVMWFDPDKPLHDRYQVKHDFLSPEQGVEVETISKVVNASSAGSSTRASRSSAAARSSRSTTRTPRPTSR